MRNTVFNFRVENQIAEVDIIGTIGEDWFGEGVTIQSIINELEGVKAQNPTKIVFNIDSLGGAVTDGIAIHDWIASQKTPTEAKITGLTASSATIIAMAADTVTMSDNALFLVHNAMTFSFGNKNDMEQTLKDLKVIDERIANIYSKKNGKSIEDNLEIMNRGNGGNGEWLSANEAQELGFVDEIFEPRKMAAMVSDDILNKFPKINKELLNQLKMSKENAPVVAESQDDLATKIINGIKGLLKNNKEETPEVQPTPTEDLENSALAELTAKMEAQAKVIAEQTARIEALAVSKSTPQATEDPQPDNEVEPIDTKEVFWNNVSAQTMNARKKQVRH